MFLLETLMVSFGHKLPELTLGKCIGVLIDGTPAQLFHFEETQDW